MGNDINENDKKRFNYKIIIVINNIKKMTSKYCLIYQG